MTSHLEYRFVEAIPKDIERSILYISLRFNTTSHLCACGCDERVVAKLSPQDWEMIYNGKEVSLHPSIGNWSFDCRSHYFIRKSKVVWANEMSDAAIKRGRALNIISKRQDTTQSPVVKKEPKNTHVPKPRKASAWTLSWVVGIWNWILRK